MLELRLVKFLIGLNNTRVEVKKMALIVGMTRILCNTRDAMKNEF